MKVFLEDSDICWFIYCVWLLSCCSNRLSMSDRNHKAHKASNPYYLAFAETVC